MTFRVWGRVIPMQRSAATAKPNDTSRAPVGVPNGESTLTSALIDQRTSLATPGPGRVLIPLSEVELGLGRPDVLLVAASKNGLLARGQRGLRLSNLTEAEILVSIHTRAPSKHSASHVRAVARRLREVGWLVADDRLPELPRLVSQSVLIEAKLRDWRSGIGQLARTTWVAQRSALLVPAQIEHLVSKALLRHNGLGLLVQRGDGELVWRLRGGHRRAISTLADLWVSELAIRHLTSKSELFGFREGGESVP
jgi:hypothetical protein